MDTPCKELRRRARESLKGNYGKSLGVTLLGHIVTFFGGIFTAGAMNYGEDNFYVAQSRGENPAASSAFHGFKKYGKTWTLWFLRGLFLFLWAFLLIIPALVKSFSYRASYCVMKDYDLGVRASIAKSKKLMWSFKAKLFWLRASFFGWALLSCLLPLFGALFLEPYIRAAEAEFYLEMLECNNVRYHDDVRENKEYKKAA